MTIKQTVAGWSGSDEDLLSAINAKTIKRKTIGRVSIAGMGDIDPTLTATFLATVRGVVNSLMGGDQAQQAQGILFGSFLDRFVNNVDGIDLANDTLRANLQALLSGAGWTQPQIDAVLGLGYVLDSMADQELQRNAIQADIDSARLAIHVETQQAKATNAAALFASRTEQAGTIQDAATLDAAWAQAWADS